jgi:hypothetical protein
VLTGVGCFSKEDQIDEPPAIDRASVLFEARRVGLIMDEGEASRMNVATPLPTEGESAQDVASYLETDVKGWRAGALADVTGGGSFGLAHARFVDGQFILIAKLCGLPDTAGGYYYEGWLLKRGAQMSVISTGRAERANEDWYLNVFYSPSDLVDHDYYVLTLEPDDGNPSPAEHILEGTLK